MQVSVGIRLVFAKQIALFQRRYSKTGFMKDFTDGKVRSASDFPDEAVVRLTASHKTKQGENKFNVWQQQQPSSSSSLNLLSSWSEILRDRPPPVAGFGMLQIVFFHFLYRAHPSIDRKGSTTTKTTTTTYLHNFFLLWSFREIEFVDISEHKSHHRTRPYGTVQKTLVFS